FCPAIDPSRFVMNGFLLAWKRLSPFLFLAGLTMLPAAAQPGSPTPFSVLTLEPSARSAALGGSRGITLDNDVAIFFHNPAALNSATSGSLSLSYLNHIGDINAGFVAFGMDVPALGSMAVGLRYLNWGTIEGADDQGSSTGSFGASDVVLSLSGAMEYADGLRLGATVHGILSTIESYSSSAVAADAGILWSLNSGRSTIGAVVHHVGTTFSQFGGEDDRLPTDLRLTVTHRLQHLPLQLSVTGRNLQAPGDSREDLDGFAAALRHMSVGGEFQFSEAFNLRVGYNHQRHQDLKMNTRLDLAGVGMGFGLKVNRFFLDYAFNSWSSLGGLHQLSIRTTV
ncbi:MAG: type IX secretion system protein PorQ, partial [Bacteroidota bacterium]